MKSSRSESSFVRRTGDGLARQSGFTLIELMISVSIIGILASVGVPSFIQYTRSAKVSEVHESLNRCYRVVIDYLEGPQAIRNGSVVKPVLPAVVASASTTVCPGSATSPAQLSASAGFIPKARFDATSFGNMGFYVADATYACYYFERSVSAALVAGAWFRCGAVTDVDDDNVVAKWSKEANYEAGRGHFRAGSVFHDPLSDNW